MATVTCSDLWVNTVTSSGHSRDKFLSHHVSGCYRVQCDNNNREMIETPTKTGSPRAPISAPSRAEPGARSPAESRPRLSLASLSLSVGNSRTKSWGRAVTRPAPSTCQPRPGHKWRWRDSGPPGQSSSYLVEFTFSCETRIECSVSFRVSIVVVQLNHVSPRDLLPKIRA